MNLVQHIMKKDLRRVTWALITWALAGAYLIIYRKIDIVQRSLWDNLGVVTIFLFGALTLALIAAIVQEDGLTEGNEHWRTKPISAGRLLVAKLGLILPLFVLVPLAVIVIQSGLIGRGPKVTDLKEALPFLTVMILACVAVAASTKDLGRYFLGGVLCLFMTPVLGAWLENRFPGQPLSQAQAMALNGSRIRAFVVLIGIGAVAVLLNQYFTRRTKLSIAMIITTCVGLACIAAFWRWTVVG